MDYTKINYTAQLNEVNDGFYLILDELVTLLPNYRTYPNLPIYAENYGVALQNFKENQADFFMLKNEMENDLQMIDNTIEIKNSQINKLDTEIKVLKERLDSLINTNDAGEGLLTDTELLHNQKYVGNIILLITVLGLCYMNKSLVNTFLE
jgi:hypothetical protein